MMSFTAKEIESADLVVVVDSRGRCKWSSHRSTADVSLALRQLAQLIEDPAHPYSPELTTYDPHREVSLEENP